MTLQNDKLTTGYRVEREREIKGTRLFIFKIIFMLCMEYSREDTGSDPPTFFV